MSDRVGGPDDPERRRLLKVALGASAAALVPGSAAEGSPAAAAAGDALDEAFSRFSKTGFFYRGGLANHGPMAAEALAALGKGDAIGSWAARYAKALDDRERPTKAIAPDGWKEALGDEARIADWALHFRRELADRPWKEVVALWSPRLAPGLFGSATHGLLRAAHAARAVSLRPTPVRLDELADGLGYWAAAYTTVPFAETAPVAATGPAEALRTVPILPVARRRSGFITARVAALAAFEEFGKAPRPASVGDPDAFLSELTAEVAALFVVHVRRPSLIALVHAMTGPSIVRLLFPFVSAEVRAVLARHAYQTAAALVSSHADPAAKVSRPSASDTVPAAAVLAERAVASGDEHAIKFTESCLREHRVRSDVAYLSAASRALDLFS